MAIYTRRLAARSDLPPLVWTELYRAPAEGSVVVRDIIVTTTNATPGRVMLQFDGLAKTGQVTFYYLPAFSAGMNHLELRQALDPGEGIRVFADQVAVAVNITGYVFPS